MKSMKFALAAFAALLMATTVMTAAPVKVVFDTDIGNDVDDVLALGMLHALQTRGACQVVAVTISNPDPRAGVFVDAIDTFYGRGDIPIGVSPDAPKVADSRFLKLADATDRAGRKVFPSDFQPQRAPKSVTLLRRVLAAAGDHEIVLVQVGFFTNTAALLESPPDDISPLTGRQLIERKVRLLSVMGGAFQTVENTNHFREFNVRMAVAAAQRVARGWPTPIVWSGWAVGNAVRFPAVAVERDFAWTPHHPLAEAYQLYRPTPHERPTWDLTAALYAVFPQRGYFGLSAPGQVTVEPDGFTRFTPTRNGRDRFLRVSPIEASQLRGLFAALCTEPAAR